MRKFFALALVWILAMCAMHLAHAENPQDHMGMAMPSTDPMVKMMRDMHQPKTGDADADFVRSMIPHHQGAVDMAQEVLKSGQDAEIQALAKSIVADQQSEIAMMRAWLAKKGIPEQGEYTAP